MLLTLKEIHFWYMYMTLYHISMFLFREGWPILQQIWTVLEWASIKCSGIFRNLNIRKNIFRKRFSLMRLLFFLNQFIESISEGTLPNKNKMIYSTWKFIHAHHPLFLLWEIYSNDNFESKTSTFHVKLSNQISLMLFASWLIKI